VLAQLDGCGIFSAVVHLVRVREGAQAWVVLGRLLESGGRIACTRRHRHGHGQTILTYFSALVRCPGFPVLLELSPFVARLRLQLWLWLQVSYGK